MLTRRCSTIHTCKTMSFSCDYGAFRAGLKRVGRDSFVLEEHADSNAYETMYFWQGQTKFRLDAVTVCAMSFCWSLENAFPQDTHWGTVILRQATIRVTHNRQAYESTVFVPDTDGFPAVFSNTNSASIPKCWFYEAIKHVHSVVTETDFGRGDLRVPDVESMFKC